MAKIEIRCPICSKWDNIEISDNATKDAKRGILVMDINAGMICEHSFIAYVDKNLIVRDCLITDFKIESLEDSSAQKIQDDIPAGTEPVKYDLIKLNIPESVMANIFRGTFLGKKIILISDNLFLTNHVINFFKLTLKDLFEINILAMSMEDFKQNKKKFDDYLVLEKRKIIQDRDKILDSVKVVEEKSFAQKFLNEYNSVSGLIILKNEIKKAFEYSKTLAQYLRDPEKIKASTSKHLIDIISEMYNERIPSDYLIFLIDIVKNYFNVEVPKIDGVTNFLGIL